MEVSEEELVHLKYASESNIDDAVDMTEPGLRRIAKCTADFTSTEDSWSPSAGHWSPSAVHWSQSREEHIYDSIDEAAAFEGTMDDYEDPDKDLLADQVGTSREDENIYEEPINVGQQLAPPDYLTLQPLDQTSPRVRCPREPWVMNQGKTRTAVSSNISDTSSDYLPVRCQSRPKSRKLPTLPNSGPPSGGFGTRLEEQESGFFSHPGPATTSRYSHLRGAATAGTPNPALGPIRNPPGTHHLYHWDPPIPPLAEEDEDAAQQQQHITLIPISSALDGSSSACQWVTVNGRRFARGVAGQQIPGEQSPPVPPPRRRRPRKEVSRRTVIPITGGLGSPSQDAGAVSGGRYVQNLQVTGENPRTCPIHYPGISYKMGANTARPALSEETKTTQARIDKTL